MTFLLLQRDRVDKNDSYFPVMSNKCSSETCTKNGIELEHNFDKMEVFTKYKPYNNYTVILEKFDAL